MKSNTEPSRILTVLTVVLIVVVSACSCFAASPGQGQLTVVEPDGKPGSGCPLEHTSVKAEIAGFVARVEVKQTFHNPRKDKIEAIYTFPLSADGAVDEMLMKVGDRTVRGEIKRREEARRIYEAARDKGHVASLLDQERPNIFTQSVANIMPGEKVEITIKYVEVLNYEEGSFKFVFPMVVGPRFIPGMPGSKDRLGGGYDSVPDASRITPPVLKKAEAGHDIDTRVRRRGVPIEKVESLAPNCTDHTDKNKVGLSRTKKKFLTKTSC
jgi:Ca-activated chloride channel family protein